jgi:hypothetical protein
MPRPVLEMVFEVMAAAGMRLVTVGELAAAGIASPEGPTDHEVLMMTLS